MTIPDDYEVPTCDGCGTVYMTQELTRRLDKVFRRKYLERQQALLGRLVQTLRVRHEATQRDIERACGVTPSYLSHLLAGRREASVTLVRLIEAFVISPTAFEFSLQGGFGAWEDSVRCVFEVNSKRTYWRLGDRFVARGKWDDAPPSISRHAPDKLTESG
ncbi:MAG: helix-turn-helix transcriptional regulator [Myxococcales bacterium]|nr:helix-turn-helix transcriptional regulator [Myxococcales bacterium]